MRKKFSTNNLKLSFITTIQVLVASIILALVALVPKIIYGNSLKKEVE